MYRLETPEMHARYVLLSQMEVSHNGIAAILKIVNRETDLKVRIFLLPLTGKNN